jgi:hypothetical protein
MALQLTYRLTGTTIDIKDAYYRIGSISINPKESVNIQMLVYKDLLDRQNNLAINDRRGVNFFIEKDDPLYDNYFSNVALKVTGKTIIIRAYEYLKQLPQYANATDI